MSSFPFFSFFLYGMTWTLKELSKVRRKIPNWRTCGGWEKKQLTSFWTLFSNRIPSRRSLLNLPFFIIFFQNFRIKLQLCYMLMLMLFQKWSLLFYYLPSPFCFANKKEEFFRLANVTILNYTLEIVNAINDGFEGEPANRTKKITNSTEKTEVAWSFSGAFLYSLTVITTIGKLSN